MKGCKVEILTGFHDQSVGYVIILSNGGRKLFMNNTKTLILKDRVRTAWIILWLILIIASVIVYINNPPLLLVDKGSDFIGWLVKFLSPHNWLILATAILTLNGLRSIWLMGEQKWPVTKDFRFVPIAIAIGGVLIFIGLTF